MNVHKEEGKVRRQEGRTHYSFFSLFSPLEYISPVLIHSSHFFSHSLSFQGHSLFIHLSLHSFRNNKTQLCPIRPKATRTLNRPSLLSVLVWAVSCWQLYLSELISPISFSSEPPVSSPSVIPLSLSLSLSFFHPGFQPLQYY